MDITWSQTEKFVFSNILKKLFLDFTFELVVKPALFITASILLVNFNIFLLIDNSCFSLVISHLKNLKFFLNFGATFNSFLSITKIKYSLSKKKFN